MLSKDSFVLEIIINICVCFDYDIDSVSCFLNKSFFCRYHDFIVNVCNLGSNLRSVFNERK